MALSPVVPWGPHHWSLLHPGKGEERESVEERTEVVHGPGLEVHPSLPPAMHNHPAMWLHPAGRGLENRV